MILNCVQGTEHTVTITQGCLFVNEWLVAASSLAATRNCEGGFEVYRISSQPLRAYHDFRLLTKGDSCIILCSTCKTLFIVLNDRLDPRIPCREPEQLYPAREKERDCAQESPMPYVVKP